MLRCDAAFLRDALSCTLQEQAVIGDTANLAARLQGVAERGTIIVAGFTCRPLGDECPSRSATLLLLPSNRV
jgi:class 3 adenylate cyclase